MSKVDLTQIDTLSSAAILEALNDNAETIEAGFDNTLSRDGTAPNSMLADMDMNSKRILNLPIPVSDAEPARLKELNDAIFGAFDPISSFSPQVANRVFAGPTGGGNAQPTFRVMVTADIPNDTVTYAKVQDVSATDRLLGRDTAAAGNIEELTVGGGLSFTGTGGIQIANDGVLYSKIQNVVNDRVLGRDTAGDGDVEELVLSGGLEFSGAPGIRIADNGVTYAKMQDVGATSRILGRRTAGPGDPEECTLSQVLDMVGSPAQGDILYRDAASWTRLGAGTSGQFLKTQGAAANPQWATPAGGGNVSGPASSTNNNLVKWSGTSGTALLDSGVVLDGSNNMAGLASLSITSSSANALAVGRGGTTNPTLKVDPSVASSVTGVTIRSAAAGGNVFIEAISSGTNEGLVVDAKGSGNISLGVGSTGQITCNRNTQVNGNLAVTGDTTIGDASGDTMLINAGNISRPNAPYFKANKNATNQTGLAASSTTQITYTNELIDQSNQYNATNSQWTPTSGVKVFIHGQALVTNAGVGTTMALGIYKNAVLIAEDYYEPIASETKVMDVSCTDTAAGTVYDIRLVIGANGSGANSVNGSVTRSFFEGWQIA